MKKLLALGALLWCAVGTAGNNFNIGDVGSGGWSSGTTLPATCTIGQLFFKTDATAGQNGYWCTATNVWTQQASGGGSGTVTSISVTTANGFAGSIINPTTTPAISLTTTVTGLMLGNGTTAAAYGGATCTNQLIRNLSASGTATCATVANTDLANSSITIAGHSVALGGTQAIAIGDLTAIATNTISGNATSGTSAMTALAVPSCSGATNALIWTTNTGFGCNTIAGGGSVSITSSAGGLVASPSPITGTGTIDLANVSATSHQWFDSVVANVFHKSQPACGDLSNGATGCSTATGTSGATIPLLNAANTWSGVQTFNTATLLANNSANTFASTILSAATATRNWTLPDATDTAVGRATTDTLTNKTYDTAGTGNVFKINGTGITAVSGTGSVMLAASPTTTGTLTGAAANFSGNITANNLTPITTLATGQVVYASSSSAANTSAGFTYDGTSKITAGVAGTSVGSFCMNNSTSGSTCLTPPTGALGTNTPIIPSTNSTLTYTVASGTSALGTGAISSASCATVVTTTATGVATTDVVKASFNGDPTAVTGYAPVTTGSLTIVGYPSSGNVNFKVCNLTSSSITPGAITLNWIVTR